MVLMTSEGDVNIPPCKFSHTTFVGVETDRAAPISAEIETLLYAMPALAIERDFSLDYCCNTPIFHAPFISFCIVLWYVFSYRTNVGYGIE